MIPGAELILVLEPEREGLKGQEHLLEPLPGFGVDQVPIAVEKLGRLGECEDEQLWLVDEMDVQEHPDLAQVVARPAPTKVASRADNGGLSAQQFTPVEPQSSAFFSGPKNQFTVLHAS